MAECAIGEHSTVISLALVIYLEHSIVIYSEPKSLPGPGVIKRCTTSEFIVWQREPMWNHTTGSQDTGRWRASTHGPGDQKTGMSNPHLFPTLSSGLTLPKFGAESISQCLRRQRIRLRHMPIAAKVCPLLREGSSYLPLPSCHQWLVGKIPPWPDVPQNPWSSIRAGPNHTQQRTLLPSPCSQPVAGTTPEDFHYLLSLSKTWAAKALFSLGFPATDASRMEIWKEFQVTNI